MYADPSNFHTGRLRPIRCIVLHAMQITESGNAAEVCAGLFQRKNFGGSTQRCVDTDSIVTSVKDHSTCFGAPGVNADGLHIEQAGFSEQTTAQWKDAASLAIIENAAIVAAEWALLYRIPLRWLTAAQIRDQKTRGFLTHWDATRAFNTPGGHWDPGDAYPRTYFMDRVAYHMNRITSLAKDWLEMATKDEVKAAVREVLSERAVQENLGRVILTGTNALKDPANPTGPRVTISNIVERTLAKALGK